MPRKTALDFFDQEGAPGAALIANLVAAVNDQELATPVKHEVIEALEAFGNRVDPDAMRGGGVEHFSAIVWQLRKQGKIAPLSQIRTPRHARWLLKIVEWDRLQYVFPDVSIFKTGPRKTLGGLTQVARGVQHKLSQTLTGTFGAKAGYSFCQLAPHALDHNDIQSVRGRLGQLGPEIFSAKIGMTFDQATPLFLVQVDISDAPPIIARPTILADPICPWFKHPRDKDCADKLGRTADLARQFADGVIEALAAQFEFGASHGRPAKIDALGFYQNDKIALPTREELAAKLIRGLGGATNARMVLEQL